MRKRVLTIPHGIAIMVSSETVLLRSIKNQEVTDEIRKTNLEEMIVYIGPLAIILLPVAKRIFILIGLGMILSHEGEIDAEADFNKGKIHVKKSLKKPKKS